MYMQTDILSRLKIIAVPPEFIPRNLLGLIPPILIYICDDISILLCSNNRLLYSVIAASRPIRVFNTIQTRTISFHIVHSTVL